MTSCMRRTRARAAAGSSRATNAASLSRFCKAAESHSTCTDFPLANYLANAFIAGEFAPVGLADRFSDLLNLPLVEVDKVPNGRSGKKRLRSLRRFGKALQALLEFRFQPDSHGLGHGTLPMYSIVHMLTFRTIFAAVVSVKLRDAVLRRAVAVRSNCDSSRYNRHPRNSR